jgi:hypothetical protein
VRDRGEACAENPDTGVGLVGSTRVFQAEGLGLHRDLEPTGLAAGTTRIRWGNQPFVVIFWETTHNCLERFSRIRKRTMRMPIALSTLLLILGSAALAGEAVDPYPLTTCIVSGESLDAHGDPVIAEHEMRELRFCSADCAKVFEGEVASYLEKLDAAIIEDQLPLYPLDTCLNSGGPLDGMGEPYNLVHGNRLVRLCCSGCVKDFTKNAIELIADLDEAVIAQQVEAYSLDTCVSSGMKLGSMGDPFDMVVAGRLVRLCCGGCANGVRNDPTAALAKLAAANEAE